MIITEQNIIMEQEDLACKWRVWISLEDGNSIMFKFKEHPTLPQIQTTLDNYLECMARMQEDQLAQEEVVPIP